MFRGKPSVVVFYLLTRMFQTSSYSYLLLQKKNAYLVLISNYFSDGGAYRTSGRMCEGKEKKYIHIFYIYNKEIHVCNTLFLL